jgi:hypothetical protein
MHHCATSGRHCGSRSGRKLTAARTHPVRRSTVLLLAAGLGCAPVLPAGAQTAPVEKLSGTYQYLVSARDTQHGALYRSSGGALKGLALPYSFSDSQQYWGEYVCRQPSVSCAVSDYYDPHDYAVKAHEGPGAVLQAERINVHNGTNIYDAATWQIAVVLGAVSNHFKNPWQVDAYELASSENRILGSKEAAPDVPAGSRATSAGALYVYNGTRITDPRSAYAFRMTAPVWLAPDPLKDSSYARFISVGALPSGNARYQSGLVSWSDWKPVTGDNAWAFLVGPLQAAHIHFVKGRGERVPFSDAAVQNAIAVLPAFAALQSSVGAVYYAPAGTVENQAAAPVNAQAVSTENNLSLYAGLRILKATLDSERAPGAALSADDRSRITRSVQLIDTMLSGGVLPGGRHTWGLTNFLRSAAWSRGELVTGGAADEAGGRRARPEPKAVDVQTWGVAALGTAQIDAWHGFGAAYHLWESLKSWGAYGEGQTLDGVGYSDADGNGRAPGGNFRSGVLSGEWTAGAIVMVRNMIRHYQDVPREAREAAQAQAFVAQLKADEGAMLAGMQRLRYHRYLTADIPGKPQDYAHLIAEPDSPVASEPYLYASRRYLIPFGWWANPLPSTTASAWAILVADHYDPFGYGGAPN